MKTFGEFLRKRQDWMRRLQWAFVGVYAFLLFAPLAAPGTGLSRVTEALFWGVWWPAVILSMMLIGQFWCGVFCPDGAITEYASRHGNGAKPAEWLRWGWWPVAAFAAITFVADATRAHSSAVGNLILVGGMSALALAVGIYYGRGRRVWCRYLCPTAFALGYPENRARTDKAIAQGNALKNKVRNTLVSKNLDGSRVKIFDWAQEGIEDNMKYRSQYNYVRNLYNTNIVFKKDADAVTAHVLNENPFRKIAIGKTQIEIGVHYLLSEFAFMLFLPEYVEEEVVWYIYHKPWPVFEKFIAGEYTGQSLRHVRFIRFPEFKVGGVVA